MPKFASLAERYRHNRKCFELGIELGCTPKEAEAWMEAVEAREKCRAIHRKLGRDLTMLPPLSTSSRAQFERWEAPHMMRD